MDSKSSTPAPKSNQQSSPQSGQASNQPASSRQSKNDTASSSNARRSTRSRSEASGVSELGSQLIEQLPVKLREDIDLVIEESEQAIRGARTYVRENPREALGLAVGVGALAWTILGTSPGRKVAQWGAMMAMPYVTKWIAERFDRGEVGSMQPGHEGTDQAEDDSLKGMQKDASRGSVLKTGSAPNQAQDTTSAQPKHTH